MAAERAGDLCTGRLWLHPVDVAEAGRIVARRPEPEDRWADDYPFEGDVVGMGAFLRATAQSGDQQPFGSYRITRRSDGLAIGGIGFKGRPSGGSVEIGYGLVPSARGNGYAAEAVRALLAVPAGRGVTRVAADTTPDNIASQRTLVRAGFRLVGEDATLHYYEINLGPGTVE